MRCDVDHIEPFDHEVAGTAVVTDGVRSAERHAIPTGHACLHQTCVDNLHALCRHHHRAKTHAGRRPGREDDGSTTWRSPTGQTYVRAPEHEPPEAPPPEPPPDGVTIELSPRPPF